MLHNSGKPKGLICRTFIQAPGTQIGGVPGTLSSAVPSTHQVVSQMVSQSAITTAGLHAADYAHLLQQTICQGKQTSSAATHGNRQALFD